MAGGIDVVDPIADGRAVAQPFPDPGRLRSHQGFGTRRGWCRSLDPDRLRYGSA